MSVTRPRPVIPAELPGLLHSLSFSVIKDRPQDIIGFAAEHFQQLLEQRKEEEETAARKRKVPKEEILDEDACAWRGSYFQPNEWQVFSDNLELEGRIDSKNSVKFRIEVYEAEKQSSSHNLDESGPNEMAGEIVKDQVSADITSDMTTIELGCDQISEEEKYAENKELNNSLTTEESNSGQTTPEPIDKSGTLSSSSELLTEELTTETEEGSNPDLTALSESSEPSENLSAED